MCVSLSRLVKVRMKNQLLHHFWKRAVQTLLLPARAARQRQIKGAVCWRMWLVRLLRRAKLLSKPAPNWPWWRKEMKREMKGRRAKHHLHPPKLKSLPKRSPSLRRSQTWSSHLKREPRPLQLKFLPRNQRWAGWMTPLSAIMYIGNVVINCISKFKGPRRSSEIETQSRIEWKN